jgi:hypothetical protein
MMKKLAFIFVLISTNLFAAMSEERFPADYFLVHKNLPHYMQVFRNFSEDTTLHLSIKQKEELQAFQEKVVVLVSEKASKIRDLELILQKKVLLQKQSKIQLKSLVSEIAKLREEMTLAHIGCINGVQNILTDEQNEFFIQKSGVKK